MYQALEKIAKTFSTWDATPSRYPLSSDHSREWLASAVDLQLIQHNVETLTDTDQNPNSDHPYPIAERLNWPIIRFGQKARSGLRGWWVSGLDPFNHWQRMSWGRFKPDANTPVLDRQKGKPAKYLSPSLGENSSRVTFLDVPQHLWHKVAARYDLSIPDLAQDNGFWPWVLKHNLPLILTEGEKKAGCLLSLGFAAIALPGIFNGYRKAPFRLIPELQLFATPGRTVYICFDYETKPQTLQNINIAISRTSNLLDKAGCIIRVITLPGPDKGVDDFVMAQGASAFEHLYQHAQSLEDWQVHHLGALTYAPDLLLNQQYLGALPFPESGLVAIKSAKGTGKTAALEAFIHNAMQNGRRVLIGTHRIQLGRATCDRLGLDWIEEMNASATQGLLGFGLCMDSLHSESQAHFNPQAWKGTILVLDEAEQVIWHMLNSQTCAEKRVQILQNFKELIQVLLSSGGLIIAQDADLSDLSIDYLKGLSDTPIHPWVVVNEWQPQWGEAFFYDTPNPAPLLFRLEQCLATQPVFLSLDSQRVKGKFSSKNLETFFQQKFPDLKILRIDSETVADPQHLAYGIVEHLNQVITQYDLVIATPTIGTGVSIDVRGHFGAVFGIFQGAIPDTEARQALARVREAVPRYVWAKQFGPGKIGNGSCNYRAVIDSTTKVVKFTIALLKGLDFDLDAASDPISLRTWAKMAARVNVSMWAFREQFRKGLCQEGHQVTVLSEAFQGFIPDWLRDFEQALLARMSPEAVEQVFRQELSTGALVFPGFEYLALQHPVGEVDQAYSAISVVRDLNQRVEAEAVAAAAEITASEYEALKEKRAKTTDERLKAQKFALQKRYGVPVTPELKLKDDQGWYSALRLHYYLTHDPAFVRLRDIREVQGHLERGEGKVALQDIRLLSLQVEALQQLGVMQLFDPERRIRGTDAEVLRIERLCKSDPQSIKSILNLTISDSMSAMQVVQILLSKLGLRLTCVSRDQAADGRRGGSRVYQFMPILDGREDIFAVWAQRDQEALEQALAEKAPVDIPQQESSIDPAPDIYTNNRGASEKKAVEAISI